jgi:hypothetical protein
MTFPPFSDYQDAFSSSLTPSMFATFTVPTWIPQPVQLLHLAKVIYPYWRDRHVERKGHRIIPHLNVSIKFNSINGSCSTPCQFDESDVPNESYICFCTSAYLDQITSGAYKCDNSLTGSAPIPSHRLTVIVDIIILGATGTASYVLSTTSSLTTF